MLCGERRRIQTAIAWFEALTGWARNVAESAGKADRDHILDLF